jgi:hypothetical protein
MSLFGKLKCFLGLHDVYFIVIRNVQDEVITAKICSRCGKSTIKDKDGASNGSKYKPFK